MSTVAGSTEHAPPTRRQVVTVLAGCGAIGFFLGMVWRPMWQDAIEPAQVLAGLVTYPPDNPVYLYSTRTWSVIHQTLALLLSLGWTERALTLVLSGLVGMIALQAQGVVVLALSRDVPLALLSPFFILVTYTASGGVTYPIALLGVPWTHGPIGLSYLLLTAGLLGAGQIRWGALLLGFGPAVHPTIGMWAVPIVTLAAAIGPRDARRSLLAAWPYFLVGAFATLLSAALFSLRGGPDAADSIGGLPAAFGQHWDEHRQPFRLLGPRALATYFSASLPAVWLWRFRRDVPGHAQFLLRILVVAAVLGGTLSISYWVVPATEPSVVAFLMPSRLLNLPAVSCMALVIGLSARYRSSLPIQSSMTVLVLLLIGLAALFASTDEGTVRQVIGWAGMGVVAATIAVVAERRRRGLADMHVRPVTLLWLRRVTRGTMAAGLAGVVVLASAGARRTFADGLRNDDPLDAAARRSGLLLTGGDLHLIQLVTRRPVLLDGGAIDGLAYVPAAVPETDRILRSVYGTTLSSVQAKHVGTLAETEGKALWESRTLYEWQDIAREFGVTDVLTYPGWTLRLPVVASSNDLTLYTIPPAR